MHRTRYCKNDKHIVFVIASAAKLQPTQCCDFAQRGNPVSNNAVVRCTTLIITWVLSSFCPARGIRPSWSKLLRMTPLRQGYVVQAVWQKCLVPRNDTALFVPYTRLGLSPDACFYCRVAIKKYRPQWRSVQTGTMINMICFCVANPMRTNLYKRQIRFDSDFIYLTVQNADAPIGVDFDGVRVSHRTYQGLSQPRTQFPLDSKFSVENFSRVAQGIFLFQSGKFKVIIGL